ncbi:fluoride efflux transporter FluC [Halalkalibacter oceani]|uniref:Fluoride-specific ion channel FluC n=1 Tax=Halalkalibacter oceani TaxID=1653776 RepID=A0A9X2DUV2_9BACI|nr:CrcB family protein [Halalkalibacter oceani]MCM3715810.1 CrcB family protein [Halalkalibacter oceani]
MKISVMKNIGAVAAGGAIGTLLRYYVNLYLLTSSFPMGTLIENITGSFALGALTGWFLSRQRREWLRVGLGVGICGGFTTMSTLAADSTALLLEAQWLPAFLYLLLSVFGGVMSALAGLLLGQKLAAKRGREVKLN